MAVDSVTFTAEAGKLTTLLGPSGCGKTTTLRAIGGFIAVESGTIMIGDRLMDTLPPYRRPTRTVFQSYALFPHMSVRENVAFGLKATSTHRREIPDRIREALQLVGLEAFADRQSGQLSGGQQQRVAFARALVTRPEVLLLDEPLSNLDAKLRVQMRLEIRRLQQEVGITTVYVTHDQEEALSLSDTIIVMNKGRIEQQGTPWEIYEHPANRFVADFIGTSNIVPAQIVSSGTSTGETDDRVTISCLGRIFEIARDRVPPDISGNCGLVIRPEHVFLEAIEGSRSFAQNRSTLTARVQARDYRGSAADYHLALEDGTELTAEVPAPTGRQLLEIGSEVSVRFDTPRVSVVSV